MATPHEPNAPTVDQVRPPVEALATERFVAAFLDQAPRSSLRLIPVATFIAYLWTRGYEPLWPGCWLLAVVTMTAWRWRYTTAHVYRVAAAERPRRVAQLLLVSGTLYAVPTLGFGVMGDFGRAALTMTLVVVATVSIITTSGYRGIYRAFAFPMVGSAAAGWLWFGWVEQSAEAALLALCILLYLSFLHGVAKHANAVFMEGCAYHLGEQQLNAELKVALADADEANRTKTQFLAAASHDLRQPMHSMSVLVAALSLRPLDPQAREIVTLLGSVNQALSRQLDTLLDMSKLDAGLVRAECTPQQLDLIVKDHHAAIAPVAAENGLRTEVSAPQPVWVRTDQRLLTRALSNLTDNAIKFTPSGGLIRLTLCQREQQAWLEISDSGIGIAHAEQERVFHEFYQVGNVERDRSKGLGLGLSIVQRLCRLLQVQLSLASSPGQGTAVTLRFALSEGEPPAAPPAPPATAQRGLRVLVVDDEATVRQSTRLLLQELGCTVLVAEGVADAREVAGSVSLDLVLSDLRLREGDSGVAAIEAVRELQPGVAAVLVTGDTAPERLRDLEASGLRLLFKPVSLEQLLSVLPPPTAAAAP